MAGCRQLCQDSYLQRWPDQVSDGQAGVSSSVSRTCSGTVSSELAQNCRQHEKHGQRFQLDQCGREDMMVRMTKQGAGGFSMQNKKKERTN